METGSRAEPGPGEDPRAATPGKQGMPPLYIRLKISNVCWHVGSVRNPLM